jgi:predicted acyltransferase
MMTGLMWHWSFPINKGIWTSSYVVFCAGMAAVSLATIMWMVDLQGFRRWTKFFVVYGTNPIVAFVGSGLLARMIYSIFKVNYGGETIALQAGIYRALFASWLPPRDASLAFAVSFVLFWYAILYVLYRKKIFLKV